MLIPHAQTMGLRPLLALPLRRSSQALMTVPMLEDLALGAYDAYEACLTAAPLPTAAVIASVLAVAGDLLSQSRTDEPFDARRAFAFATFGALYTGVFQYQLFAALISTLDGSHLSPILDGAMAGSSMVTPSIEFIGAAERTLVNQLFIIPSLYYPLFFLVTGLAYSLTPEQMLDRGRELYLPLIKRNLGFWLPVQFFQFAYVEESLQLPFVCVAGLVWNFILSAVSLAADKERESALPAVVSTGSVQPGQTAVSGLVVPTSQSTKESSGASEQVTSDSRS